MAKSLKKNKYKQETKTIPKRKKKKKKIAKAKSLKRHNIFFLTLQKQNPLF